VASDKFHAPTALPAGRDSSVPIEIEAAWAHIRSGHRRIQQSLALPVFEPRFLGKSCVCLDVLISCAVVTASAVSV
jgi:hypothetical protein